MATVMARVQDVVADKLGVDKASVVADANFVDDLNADSLDLVELIMAFEEEFSTSDKKIEISDEDAEKITNVQQAIDFLKAKGVKDS
ncbi:MAG: acyl carrier protein [SAR202 cluster bacterium]|nr:acyl carrier protein [SAR202 cluster bacterium]